MSVDIAWHDKLEEALARARAAKRLIVVKPMGQGIGPADNW